MSSHFSPDPSPPESTIEMVRGGRVSGKMTTTLRTIVHHVKKHAGVGIIIAVGYFDPGNWSVDLQAGSTFGYRPMLFVILLAGIMAIILQVSPFLSEMTERDAHLKQILAARLGSVTGLDLATHCRIWLYKHPKHPKLIRRCVLYPLYVLSEIAIISTDLAELLGSAIGLCLLFPKLPIWAGVLITGVDVLIFLIVGDPTRNRGRPVRFFEIVMVVLVAIVFICFVILVVKVSPNWPEAFYGFVPSDKLFQSTPNALYIAIGIIGSTVMPHTLFLGSYLSTQDRVEVVPIPLELPDLDKLSSSRANSRFRRWWQLFEAQFRAEETSEERKAELRIRHGHRENNPLSFIKAHMKHGLVDIVMSLLAVAVPINAAIVIVAATVFYDPNTLSDGSLFKMHTLLGDTLGKGAAFMFALALVCSGQTASITATFAGQLVSEGFIQWRISPFLRRLITRLLSLIPSMIVAISSGRSGINRLLIASQVVLSVVLPFVAFPLIYLTASRNVMYAKRGSEHPDPSRGSRRTPIKVRSEEKIDFSNSYMMTGFAFLVWAVVVVANVYVIVMLGMGDTGQ
ncbi:Nramp-domain-containing protein [Coniophora puteana RWD-64-598 SS2]|uniref:Nramp-domain-containing protein n=1 Tax=Coniophora puteana (strain RWD-64-598) TaxID=741705 RepID=A0A5M3MMA8_CONPW|nr:Nramp-domain-containing protein [Coniophora puteana RWD-64-598 SS2]EIW80308.1 Nramp-domain-containing protein [Coniophora puteana RWD-64-598 SS2]